MKLKALAAVVLTALSVSAQAQVAAKTADVVVLMDESGSMSGEQTWMSSTIGSLDAALVGANVTNNRYGLVGFGSAMNAPTYVRSISVGGGQFGTSAQYQTASSSLRVDGSVEDGFAAINMANTYSFRSDAARNYILVTDEDRDITQASSTFATMLSSLKGTGSLLNAVVNASFVCGDGRAALGLDSQGHGYVVGANGTYSTCTGATNKAGYSFGTTVTDYVSLALQSGGAAWDLNVLRSGGNNALAFSKAFQEIKVTEIVNQTPVNPVPEPELYAMMGLGVLTVGWASRRKSSAKTA